MTTDIANPNVFIIGAPKCGTTSLAAYLRQHPDILVSKPKETCFHFLEYDRGVQYYKDKYFGEYNGQKIVCDMSILNMYYCNVSAPRIYKDFPDSKIIAILRNPIARAFSDYRESLNRGLEILPFEKTFEVESKRKNKDKHRITQGMYFSRGLYFAQLDTYLNFFNKTRLKIFIYEKLFKETNKSLRELFGFLGIDDQYNINTIKKRNVNKSYVRNIYIQRFLRGDHLIGNILKIIIPTRYRENMSMLAKKLKQTNIGEYKKTNINTEFKEKLKQYYEESNKNLEKEFNLDLSTWDK